MRDIGNNCQRVKISNLIFSDSMLFLNRREVLLII
jgi:hypothetical protein